MDEAKGKFLSYTGVSNEASALHKCLLASFRRNKIYEDNITQIQRRELRDSLREELFKLSLGYRLNAISEAEHEANILHLADEMSKKHRTILLNGRFNIGTSQKALNVYLKFLWCLGELPDEPVHCPLDRIILNRAFINGSWTSLDDIQIYRAWIRKVRSQASPLSMSTWELTAW